MEDIYAEGGRYGDRPPDSELGYEIYEPLEERTLPEVVAEYPDAFKIDPEAAAAIERGEKTPLQIKEERANALGMSLRDYLTEEQVAKDREAWNAKMRSMGIEPPKTEKYGYGEYGRVDDLHAKGFKYGDKPPDDWQAPDYSPEGRARFSEIVMKQVGGDPFTMNLNTELEKATSANRENLFNEVFRGQVLYGDRAKMSKKQRDHWQSELNRWRSHVSNDMKAKQKIMEFQYNTAMNEFDARAKRYDAAQKEIQKKMGRIVEMFHPDKDYTIKVPFSEVEKYEAEGWIMGTKTSVANKTPTIGDYKRQFDMEMEAFEEDNLVEGKYVDPATMEILEKGREALGLPPLDTGVGEGGQEEKTGFFTKLATGFIKNFWLDRFPELAETGKSQTVGIEKTEYATPEEVRDAFRRGELSRDEAKKILMERF